MQTEREKKKTKLLVTFHNFVKAPKKEETNKLTRMKWLNIERNEIRNSYKISVGTPERKGTNYECRCL
jgi:hypothetical protein